MTRLEDEQVLGREELELLHQPELLNYFDRRLDDMSPRLRKSDLVAQLKAMLDEILAKLTPANHPLAVGLAAIPEKIRGFGPVKARHLAAAKADEAALLEQFRSGEPPLLKAAE